MGSTIIEIIKNKSQDVMAQRSADRQISAIGDKVAANLCEVFDSEEASLSENSKRAVMMAVAETLDNSRLSVDILVKSRLEPTNSSNHLLQFKDRHTVGFGERRD